MDNLYTRRGYYEYIDNLHVNSIKINKLLHGASVDNINLSVTDKRIPITNVTTTEKTIQRTGDDVIPEVNIISTLTSYGTQVLALIEDDEGVVFGDQGPNNGPDGTVQPGKRSTAIQDIIDVFFLETNKLFPNKFRYTAVCEVTIDGQIYSYEAENWYLKTTIQNENGKYVHYFEPLTNNDVIRIPKDRESYECGVKGTHFEPTNECELEELIYQFEAAAELWTTDTELSTLKYTGQFVMNLRRCAIKLSKTDYQDVLNYFVNTIGCLIAAYMYAKYRMDAISPAQVALATCLPIDVQNGLFDFYNFIQARRFNNQRVTTDMDIIMEQFMRMNIDGTKDTPLDLSWDAIKFNNQCAVLYKFPTNFAVDKTHLYIPHNEEKDFIFAPIVCVFPNISYHLGFGYKGDTIVNEEATSVTYKQYTPNYWGIDSVGTIHIDNHTITQTEENLSQHNFRTNFYALGSNETEAVTQQKPEWELETKYAHCEFENPYKVYQELNHHLVNKSIACNNLKANPDTIPKNLSKQDDVIEVMDKMILNNGATVTDDQIANSTDVVNKDYVDKILTQGISFFYKTTMYANYESVVILLCKYELVEKLYENIVDGKVTITKNGNLNTPFLTSFEITLHSGYGIKKCYYKINYNDKNGKVVTCTYNGEKYFAWNITGNAQWGDITFIGKVELKEMEQDNFLKPISYLRQQPNTEDVILNDEVYNSIVDEISSPQEVTQINGLTDINTKTTNNGYLNIWSQDRNCRLRLELWEDGVLLSPNYLNSWQQGIWFRNNKAYISNFHSDNFSTSNINCDNGDAGYLNIFSNNVNSRLKLEFKEDSVAIAPVYDGGFKEGIVMKNDWIYIDHLESAVLKRNLLVDDEVEYLYLQFYSIPCHTDIEFPKWYVLQGPGGQTYSYWEVDIEIVDIMMSPFLTYIYLDHVGDYSWGYWCLRAYMPNGIDGQAIPITAKLKITRKPHLIFPNTNPFQKNFDELKAKIEALETKEDNKITEMQTSINTINEHFNNLIWFFEGDYTGNFYPKINNERINKSQYTLIISKKSGNASVEETDEGDLYIKVEFSEKVSFVVIKYK